MQNDLDQLYQESVRLLAVGLLPILHLNNVPLGISNILKSDQPHVRHISYRKLTNGGAAMVKDCPRCSRNIIDCKGNMRESWCIRIDGWVLRHGVILKEFEGWSIISVARKAEMDPADV